MPTLVSPNVYVVVVLTLHSKAGGRNGLLDCDGDFRARSIPAHLPSVLISLVEPVLHPLHSILWRIVICLGAAKVHHGCKVYYLGHALYPGAARADNEVEFPAFN